MGEQLQQGYHKERWKCNAVECTKNSKEADQIRVQELRGFLHLLAGGEASGQLYAYSILLDAMYEDKRPEDHQSLNGV